MDDHRFRFSQLNPTPNGGGPITLVAWDPYGNLLATAEGDTMDHAQEALRDAVIRHLVRRAQHLENPLLALTYGPPGPGLIALSVLDLFPIVLRYRRRSKNLTQSEMAIRLGIRRSSYTELETPGVNPRLDRFLKVQQALGARIIKALYDVEISGTTPRTRHEAASGSPAPTDPPSARTHHG